MKKINLSGRDMERILTISEWLIQKHPELVADEADWSRSSAWMSFYSFMHDKEFAVTCENFDSVRADYDDYVKETHWRNERERKNYLK